MASSNKYSVSASLEDDERSVDQSQSLLPADPHSNKNATLVSDERLAGLIEGQATHPSDALLAASLDAASSDIAIEPSGEDIPKKAKGGILDCHEFQRRLPEARKFGHGISVYLSRHFLIAQAVLFALMLAALEIVNHISVQNHGLATSNEGKHYLWRYGPSLSTDRLYSVCSC